MGLDPGTRSVAEGAGGAILSNSAEISPAEAPTEAKTRIVDGQEFKVIELPAQTAPKPAEFTAAGLRRVRQTGGKFTEEAGFSVLERKPE